MSFFFEKDRKVTNYNYPVPPNLPRENALTEAQQQYRFILNISGIDAAYIKDVQRPSYTLQTQEVKLLNWTSKYPKTIDWKDISFTVIEVFSKEVINSVAGVFMDKLLYTAYDTPNLLNPQSINVPNKDLAKRDLIDSLGPFKIRILNPAGDIVEEWVLRNAFIVGMTPTQVTYETENLSTLSFNVAYDWAEFTFFKDSGGNTPSPRRFSSSNFNNASIK